MRRLTGANPATAVAVSGVVIVVLIVTAVGVAVWRFNDAEDSYQRIARHAVSAEASALIEAEVHTDDS